MSSKAERMKVTFQETLFLKIQFGFFPSEFIADSIFNKTLPFINGNYGKHLTRESLVFLSLRIQWG